MSSMNEWQPIESAPKDGKTVVDLLVDGKRVADCCWAQSWHENGDGTKTPVDSVWNGWTKAWGSGAYPVYVKGDPTHWMPQPGEQK